MSDTYKGDSPAKKMVRFEFWLEMQRFLGMERFKTSRIAFLAGNELGDASTLIGLGKPCSQLIAVEKEAEVHENLQYLAQGLPVVHLGDVEEVLCRSKYRRSLDVVLLDTCSPLSVRWAKKAARIANYALKEGGVIATGFMRGREQSKVAKETLSNGRTMFGELHEEFRRVLSVDGEERGALLRKFYDYACKSIGYSGSFEDFCNSDHVAIPDEPDEDEIRHLNASSHHMAVVKLLNKELQHVGAGSYCIYGASYQSATVDSRGIPMAYTAASIFRGTPTRLASTWRQKTAQFDEAHATYIRAPLPVSYEESLDLLKKRAVAVGRVLGSERAAALLCVEKGVVAAWMAHDTRRLNKAECEL